MYLVSRGEDEDKDDVDHGRDEYEEMTFTRMLITMKMLTMSVMMLWMTIMMML